MFLILHEDPFGRNGNCLQEDGVTIARGSGLDKNKQSSLMLE